MITKTSFFLPDKQMSMPTDCIYYTPHVYVCMCVGMCVCVCRYVCRYVCIESLR